jgi:hypothetical protein
LSKSIDLGPGEAAQYAKLETLRFAALDAEGERANLNLRLGNAALLLRRRLLFDQDKIDAIEVGRQH